MTCLDFITSFESHFICIFIEKLWHNFAINREEDYYHIKILHSKIIGTTSIIYSYIQSISRENYNWHVDSIYDLCWFTFLTCMVKTPSWKLSFIIVLRIVTNLKWTIMYFSYNFTIKDMFLRLMKYENEYLRDPTDFMHVQLLRKITWGNKIFSDN